MSYSYNMFIQYASLLLTTPIHRATLQKSTGNEEMRFPETEVRKSPQHLLYVAQ